MDKKKIRYNFCFLALLIFFINIQSQIAQGTSILLEKGRIIPKVICEIDTEQSYALYLPSDYSVEKKWSIIYIFEPAARSLIPMRLFKEAAEKYKYILLCSNNSRNGPSKNIVNAIKAMWIDSHKRFSIILSGFIQLDFLEAREQVHDFTT